MPRVLDWESGAASACLIFSGLGGFSEHFGLAAETGNARDAARMAAARSWLEAFREKVSVERIERELGGTAGELAALERLSIERPEVAELHDFLKTKAGAGRPAASHGDFWSGNLLFDGTRLGVIDWEGLAARDAYHDLFSLLTHCSYLANGRVQMDISPERFLQLYFGDSAATRFAKAAFAELGPRPEELRASFYGFVAKNVRSKGGRYRESWFRILAILRAGGFPAPWSVPESALKTQRSSE
jgi:aminoglycoside phosphotransferase